MALQLRDYQLELIGNARAALRRKKRVLIQLPTGGGKTAIASFIAGSTIERGHSAYFICHRAELVHQTSLTFSKFEIPHGHIAAGVTFSSSNLGQVCSIDTLKRRISNIKEPRLAIWDECHHMGAAGWQEVMKAWPNAFHVGLSATPWRLDGSGLGEHFDEMVQGPSVAWLIENGHLSPYLLFAPNKPDMKGVRKQMGDYARGEAEKVMSKPKLTGDAITQWRKLANGMRSVGFAVSVAHSKHLAEQFNAAGIPAAHLDGSTQKAERTRVIRDYAEGRTRVLFNVDLFGEGFDLSAIAQRDVTIDCVMQLRPTQSLSLNLQQVGRALRPAPGKTAIILDHAGNSDRHGYPDDDREWTLEPSPSKDSRAAANDNGPPPPHTCLGCYLQIRRPLPPSCPHCGKSIFDTYKPPEVADEDLVLRTEQDKAAARRQRAWEQEQAKTLDELTALGAKQGYKNPQGWAWRVWSSRPENRRTG